MRRTWIAALQERYAFEASCKYQASKHILSLEAELKACLSAYITFKTINLHFKDCSEAV